jgi:hypothetical protein
MKTTLQLLLVLTAFGASSCSHQPPPKSSSGKVLRLETIDHGPMRPKTYLYREVDASEPQGPRVTQ